MTTTTAGFTLDTLTRNQLEKRRRREKGARIHQRLSALLWLNQGYAPAEVADLLAVCPRTIANGVALFQAGGVEALRRLAYHGDPG